MKKTMADWKAEAEAFKVAALREHDRYCTARADAVQAELEAAHWRTAAVIAQSRLTRLEGTTK